MDSIFSNLISEGCRHPVGHCLGSKFIY